MSEAERIARLLCRLDALRNNGNIGSATALNQHVDWYWTLFSDDARQIRALATLEARGG